MLIALGPPAHRGNDLQEQVEIPAGMTAVQHQANRAGNVQLSEEAKKRMNERER